MMVAALLLLAGERTALGVWQRWAALRDAAPTRCFAIAQPLRGDGTPDRRGGFASIAPREARAVFFRLSVPRGRGAITLAVGERRFALAGERQAARAPDAAADRAIVGALRGGGSMSLSYLAAGGRPVAEAYALDGAATAIDAAAIGCAGRD
jgi:hypothetical protein